MPHRGWAGAGARAWAVRRQWTTQKPSRCYFRWYHSSSLTFEFLGMFERDYLPFFARETAHFLPALLFSEHPGKPDAGHLADVTLYHMSSVGPRSWGGTVLLSKCRSLRPVPGHPITCCSWRAATDITPHPSAQQGGEGRLPTAGQRQGPLTFLEVLADVLV